MFAVLVLLERFLALSGVVTLITLPRFICAMGEAMARQVTAIHGGVRAFLAFEALIIVMNP
jgi:hypothetical protein